MTIKSVFLCTAVMAALLTTSTRAEVTDCQEILSVPVTISTQGVHCFKSDKASNQSSGNIIEITVNNVTINMNGFKLGGLGALAGTEAIGIFAQDQKNITIRNGTIRGFKTGIFLDENVGTSSGHLVEDLLLDQNRFIGVEVDGSGHIIRNNRVVNTGSGSTSDIAAAIVVTASNTVVADNIVSGTSESTSASGIFVDGSTLVEVRGNTVLDTKVAATTHGIDIADSFDVTVIGNRILNTAGTGTAGVNVSGVSSGINCIDNTVFGFGTALSVCDFEAGTNPPQP